MADVAAPFSRLAARPLVLVSGALGMLAATAAALWAHYGTAVFFEIVRAGFICF